MAKKTKPTVVKEEKAKDHGVMEEYYNIHAFSMLPAYHQTKINLAKELVNWADTLKDTAIMEDFYDSKGITEQTYTKWRSDCEQLKHAHDYAVRRLAGFRVRGSSNNSLNAAFNKWILPHFWKAAAELNKQEAENKAAASKDVHQATHINVYDHANIEGSNDKDDTQAK